MQSSSIASVVLASAETGFIPRVVIWEGENRQRSLRAAYVSREVSAKTTASIVGCAQHPLQRLLHVPHHIEICKALYSLTR